MTIAAEMYHGIIAILISAVLILSGLWVRAHDRHRQWSLEKINDHERALALLEQDFKAIHVSLNEIKKLIYDHTRHDAAVHDAILRKFNIEVDEA